MKYIIAIFLSFLGQSALSNNDILKPYSGPYTAKVVRVIDGDTIDLSVEVWPGLIARYAVRERGIDAPEIKRVSCSEEKVWGLEAKAQIEKLFPIGTVVRLDDVEIDSFGGRVVADIKRLLPSDQFISLEWDLLSRELAVEWTPKMADVPWCLLAQARG